MLSRIVRVDILGGADIGKSSALVEVLDRDGQHKYIMIDCGVGFARGNEPVPLPLRPRVRPDLLVKTHGHSDHIMLAPRYLADYDCPTWMTGPTYFTADFLMLDHLRVAELRGTTPVFNRQEYVRFHTSDKVEIFYHSDWMEVFPGVSICFYPCGHIRGAASILLETDIYKSMFSGDISFNNTPTVRGMVPPLNFHPDALFLDSTNGCNSLPNREAEVQRLVEMAGQYRLALVPAFGVGRSPDIALDLARHDYPVFLDGMGRAILKAYGREEMFWCENDREIPPEIFNRIRFIKGGDPGRERVAYDFRPKAVVTTSGMMAGGPVMHYAEKWLGKSDAAVLDVGYVAPNTPGGQLLQSVESGMPFEIYPGHEIKVAAHVAKFYLSAHIDGPQNVELVKSLQPKKVYTGHGEPVSREGLAGLLRSQGFDAEALQEGQVIEFE